MAPEVARARRQRGSVSPIGAVTPQVTRSSGVDLHEAAGSGHARQDTALRPRAGLESLVDVHLHVAFEQFRRARPAASLATPRRNVHAVRLSELEDGLARTCGASFSRPGDLDRAVGRAGRSGYAARFSA